MASLSFSNPVSFLAASMAYEKPTKMMKLVSNQIQDTCAELHLCNYLKSKLNAF